MLMLFPIIVAALVWIYIRLSENETQKYIDQMSEAMLAPINQSIELQRHIFHDARRQEAARVE